MLEEFLHRHDVDIILLQEVTNGDKLVFKGYQSIINIGTLGRGTAILYKLHLQLYRFERIPTRRWIAAYLENTCIVNMYAPSGTANRSEREEFFNSDVVELLPQSPTKLTLDGDFNCVLSNGGCTGQRTCSRALDRLIYGIRLKDALDVALNPHAFTNFTSTGAARLGRIYSYMTEDLLCNKQGTEIMAADFTDHLSV